MNDKKGTYDGNSRFLIRSRVHVVRDAAGRAIDDIDTDMIFHNAHLAVTAIEEMGKFAFGNLEGWRDFPKRARPGDILVVGKNFGAGSSRQQAVDCFRALGIAAILGESFGAIYFRNAVNAGLPVLAVPGIMESGIEDGDRVRVDLEKSIITAEREDLVLPKPRPFSKVQLDIYRAGSLFKVRPAE